MRKKNHLMVCSIITVCLMFLYGWVGDYLFNRLFLLDVIIFFAILIGFFICLIFAFKKENRCSFWILAAGALVFLLFPFREARVKTEFILYANARDKVVEMVKSRELSPDDYGNIKLPFRYGFTSSDEEVHVYDNDAGDTIMTFWVFRGMLSGSCELMYADGGEEQIKEELRPDQIESIEKLKDNWYYVKTLY